MTAQRDAQTAEVYQAVGRFVVEFSQLQRVLEAGVIVLVGGDEKQRTATQILLAGERGPEAQRTWSILLPLLEVRFQELPDPLAPKALAALKSEINHQGHRLLKHRNDLAHAAWFVGWGNDETTDWSAIEVMKLKAGGTFHRPDFTWPKRQPDEPLTATHINRLADQCRECALAVQLMTWPIGITGSELSDWLHITEAGRLRIRERVVPDEPQAAPERSDPGEVQ